MANLVLQDQKIFLAHYNLTANINTVALNETRDALDDTTLGSNTKSNFPGLLNTTFQIEGLYDPSTQHDLALSSQIGIQGVPFSVLNSTTLGGRCYFLNAMQADYTPFSNNTGELAAFSAGGVSAKASSAPANLIRGQVAFWTENFTTSSLGSFVNLGAVSTQQRLYAAVHIIAGATAAYTVLPIITSSTYSAATSSESNTRISFSTFSALGSSMLSSTGNITDTWFRLQHVTVTPAASTGISMVAVFGVY